MKPRIFISRKIPDRGLNKIKEYFDIDLWPKYGPPTKKQIIRRIKNADGMVSLLSDKIDAEVMDAAPYLSIIAQLAVGYDNIDINEATKRGIYVTNTPEVLTETTADFAWALMMAVARRVVEADNYVRKGKWKVGWHPEMFLGYDVHGSTLGIVGLGRIGSAIARRAKGFNMRILYYDTIRREDIEKELGIIYTDLDNLLKESDFVTLHVPLTNETRHLINEERLKLMKKNAIIINTSRGPVIDEKALYKALKEKWIAGAGLDVLEKEPPLKDNPLFQLDNVIVTPHMAWYSIDSLTEIQRKAAEEVARVLSGQLPINLVNKDVLKFIKI